MEQLAGGPVIVRPARQDDAHDVWAWRNDPHTRAMSRIQDEVSLETHLAWFHRALTNPEIVLLIGEAGGETVGMVRFDRAGETEVSINVNPAVRGRGYGLELLSAALGQVEGPVVAEIRDENRTSRKLFERAGFTLFERRDGLGRYRHPGKGPTGSA